MKNKIRKVINDNNLKVKEIIRQASVSKSYFYDVMNGKTVPSVEKANDISKALNTTIQELFFSEEEI